MPAQLERLPDDVEPVSTKSKYSQPEVDTGLTCLAHMGNSRRASEHLTAIGLKIAPDTLRHWRNVSYPRRYQALAEHIAPQVEKSVVVQARDAALNAGQAVHEAIDLERTRIDSGDVKDASSSAYRLALAMGISVDKFLTLEGRPQAIIAHRDVTDAIAELRDLAPNLFSVDSTAEEIEGDAG